MELSLSISEKATRHQLTEIKTILNGIYDYAVIRDIVPVNVARNCNTRTIRTKAEQNDPYNVYTQSDRAKILLALKDSTDPYDLAICMMFCLCCRVGEIEAMHFEDINQETQEILIHSEIVHVTGIDGNSGYFKEADHTKTGDDSGVDRLPLTATAMEIVNRCLIPALDAVGRGFEKGSIFLPQLLMSAEAARAAFDVIKEAMKGAARETKGTVILATVKGDIHDIGKNIVKVLLENYGYDVRDLGKDVPPETIVEAACETGAPLVGLSALMTTTVVSMEETIRLLRKARPDVRIVVGGAVMTKQYADEIGADYYAREAMDTVRYADRVFEVL